MSDLDLTFVSPTGDYAVSHGLEALRLLRWSGQNLSETALQTSGMPDQISFSPSGEVVAIYYKGSGTIEVWAGLPDTLRVAFRNRTEAVVRALAVSDDASAAVGAAENGLVLITSDGERLISGATSQPWRFFEEASMPSLLNRLSTRC